MARPRLFAEPLTGAERQRRWRERRQPAGRRERAFEQADAALTELWIAVLHAAATVEETEAVRAAIDQAQEAIRRARAS